MSLRPLSPEEKILVLQVFDLLPRTLGRMSCAMQATGLPKEDVIPEITLTFARRLQGQNPYDPKRGTLPTYVHWLAKTWIQDQAKKLNRRIKRHEEYAEAA